MLLSVETCVELYGQLSDRYSRARLAPGWATGTRYYLTDTRYGAPAPTGLTRERARTTRSTGDVARDIKCGTFIRDLSSRCRIGIEEGG